MRAKNKLFLGVSVLAMAFGAVLPVYAQSSSPNYRVEEAFFGTGGEVDANSANFRANQSTGALGVGNTSSNNYDAYAGFLTPNEPFLEMMVMDAFVDFGELPGSGHSFGAAQAGSCSCSFYVRTYLSSDYTVVTVSNPPTQESGFSLNSKSTQDFPTTNDNIEEFGMNLVVNGPPYAMGQNPVNLADDSFADGQAAPGYERTNEFKYNKGDIVARSAATTGNQAVGVTEYTVSYIAKRNNITRAGLYKMDHELVVVPTY